MVERGGEINPALASTSLMRLHQPALMRFDRLYRKTVSLLVCFDDHLSAPAWGGTAMAAIEELREDAVDVLDLLGRTADGMVAVAPGGAILSWNGGAAGLLDYGEDDVLGRPCHEVLGWADRCGNPICSAFCAGCRPGDSDELVASRDVVARSKSGRAVWLSVSTLVPPPEIRRYCQVVHFFREVGLPPELERLVADRLLAQPAPVEDDGDA